jgi:hypothetical protein
VEIIKKNGIMLIVIDLCFKYKFRVLEFHPEAVSAAECAELAHGERFDYTTARLVDSGYLNRP